MNSYPLFFLKILYFLYCQRQRQVLKEIFKGSNPKIVGLENIITKDTKSKEIGITMHLSRFKITAVFSTWFMFLCQTGHVLRRKFFTL